MAWAQAAEDEAVANGINLGEYNRYRNQHRWNLRYRPGQPSTDNIAVAGYQIFRNDVLIAATASTNYSDSDLSNGVTYSYYAVVKKADKK